MSQRRGHNEGTIYRHPKGWCGQVRLSGKRLSFYGQTKAEVQQKIAAARLLDTQGQLTSNTRQTVSDFLNGWLSVVKTSVRPTTFDSYALNVRRVEPHVGTLRLTNLKPTDVQRCYAALRAGGLSARSVEQCHTVLRGALDRAVQLELIRRNPTDAVSVPRPQRAEMTILTADQAQRLFKATEGTRFHALWILLATTGLRIGEAMGLRWTDLDLEVGKAIIQRALQYQTGTGLVFVEPKSRSSRRTVVLSEVVCDVLSHHRQQQDEHRRLLGDEWHDTGLVFCSDLGAPFSPDAVNFHLTTALRRAGLPHVRVHDLRHTAASLLLAEGIHPKVVQEMLGHSTITLTLSTYSHVLPSLHREAANTMDSLFRGTKMQAGSTDPDKGIE